MPIRILDAAIMGRIAAGEVVERPGSVVKELIENSLDAGATSITVEIKNGGIDYMRVSDNGCGIEPNQVRLAFQNHATSKLASVEQLDEILTLGFRGEALPSIASVSHLEMLTHARGFTFGMQALIDGGEDLRVQEAGCPEGTTVVMRDLFYNIPVRKAFLKHAQYEGGLVQDVIARMILGNPKVNMRFINNGNCIYQSYGDGLLRHAVFTIYGKECAEKMIELDAAEGVVHLYGLIGVGEQAKMTRAHQAFFINGRSVRCTTLTRALEEVCKTRITRGFYPMCVLNLDVPPSIVNVNVHPNKMEVRFKDEANMRETAERLIWKAFTNERVLKFARPHADEPPLQKASNVLSSQPEEKTPDNVELSASEPIEESPKEAAAKPAQPPRQMDLDPNEPSLNNKEIRTIEYSNKVNDELQKLMERKAQTALRESREMADLRNIVEAARAVANGLQIDQGPTQLTLKGFEEAQYYRIIGVLMKTYILVETNDSLVIIDQHAAHERLNYEKMLVLLEDGRGSQRLLVPIVVHLSAREMALIQENIEVLREVGYEVEPFGEQDVQLRAVPFILGKSEFRPAFMETVSALNRVRQATDELRREEIMQMACKASVKGGELLTENEVESLIVQMLETGAPPTCPHGRPVMKAITQTELEKMFKRIQ